MSPKSDLAGARVLSIRQPWAWAIAAGHKKVENRSWRARYRGPVLIHAGTKLDREAAAWLLRKARIRTPQALAFGSIIAVAVLSDVITRSGSRRFHPWFFGPYGFVFTKVRVLKKPIKVKGRLGLFRASPAIVRAVDRLCR